MKNSIYLKPSGRIYYILGFVVYFILTGIILSFSQFFPPYINPYQIILGLLILNFIFLGAVFLYFQHRYIHVEDEIITVREGGLFTNKMTIIPFNKIVEIKTQHELHEKFVGVETIMIDIAGRGVMEVVFKNVPQESVSSFISFFKRYKESKKIDAKNKSILNLAKKEAELGG